MNGLTEALYMHEWPTDVNESYHKKLVHRIHRHALHSWLPIQPACGDQASMQASSKLLQPCQTLSLTRKDEDSRLLYLSQLKYAFPL